MDAQKEDITRLTLDYEQTLAYFHSLHEVRFKLLAFLPALTGLAVVLAPPNTTPAQQFALACIGLIVTLGITSYDQRNSVIYDRLVCRARFLEKKLAFYPLPDDIGGGPFHCRPPLKKIAGVLLVWHIQGLTLVYSASITAWCYLGVASVLSKPWLIALMTIAAFVASYLGLRIVSRVHHIETREIKRKLEHNDTSAQ